MGPMQDNWLDVVWEKVDYLTYLGLKPWYYPSQQAVDVAPHGTVSTAVPPTSPVICQVLIGVGAKLKLVQTSCGLARVLPCE